MIPWLHPWLGNRLATIRAAVKVLLDEGVDPKGALPGFTPHGTEHFEAVEALLHRLLPGESAFELTEYERFLLLASAWTHDIGMIRGIFASDSRELPTPEVVRETHDRRSVQYLTESRLFLGIEEPEVPVLAGLARYHRRRYDLEECEELVTVGDTQVRLRLLAAYLRLADALDVDISRVRSEDFAIALSFDLPVASKLHWVRSRFVQGIDARVGEHRIVVTFKRLRGADVRQKWSLEDVHDLVRSDLQSELDSVRTVLLEAGITYFLRIDAKHVDLDDTQLEGLLASVLNYYQLLDNPSSSGLARLLLDTAESIADLPPEAVVPTLKRFLADLDVHVLATRPCHVALRRIATEVRAQLSTSPPPLVEWVKGRRRELEEQSAGLQQVACAYLEERHPEAVTGPGTIDVLLYGYSDQVMRSLLGFRDAVCLHLQRASADRRAHEACARIEQQACARFRLFVCEGQPKNHVEYSGRVRFHDGSNYAVALARLGFGEIYVVPDAVACSLILPPADGGAASRRATFVMVGANGFDDQTFVHSAGHLMVVAARTLFTRGEDLPASPPTLLLAVTTDKYAEAGLAPRQAPGAASAPSFSQVDGWRFRGSFAGEPVRRRPFFAQDAALRKRLAEEAPGVAFYNPREDRIPIRWLDAVLTERRYFVLADMPDGVSGRALLAGAATASAATASTAAPAD